MLSVIIVFKTNKLEKVKALIPAHQQLHKDELFTAFFFFLSFFFAGLIVTERTVKDLNAEDFGPFNTRDGSKRPGRYTDMFGISLCSCR